MKTFFIGLTIVLMNFSAFECGAQTSRLPKGMPSELEIHFNKNAGMIFAFTKIEIANRTITVEEKNYDEQKARKWSAKIKAEEQENLYKIFVENKFDTIKNDKSEGIVYDAGSEGISINVGGGAFYNISYGPNSPMSGNNLKRYQAIANAINALRSSYEGEAQKFENSNFAVLQLSPKEFAMWFKNSKSETFTDEDISEVRTLLKRAVDDYNSKLEQDADKIKLDEYKFQIVGSINEKGEKVGLVNALCSEFENWQTSFISVEDGGKCYFQLFVNLTKKSFDRFSVNGDA